jgi:hypothetical protein
VILRAAEIDHAGCLQVPQKCCQRLRPALKLAGQRLSLHPDLDTIFFLDPPAAERAKRQVASLQMVAAQTDAPGTPNERLGLPRGIRLRARQLGLWIVVR